MIWLTKKLKELGDKFFTRKLKVPYIPQINENACGAAVLEMIYKHYGLNNISQLEIMNKYQENEPHNSGNLRITSDNIVADALSRGFLSFWARADYRNRKSVINLFKILTQKSQIPTIVCQKFSDNQPQIGHFRIVVGLEDDNFLIHDPNTSFGGANQKWGIDKFLDYWQPTGLNVTGGIFVIIKKL